MFMKGCQGNKSLTNLDVLQTFVSDSLTSLLTSLTSPKEMLAKRLY